MNAFFRPPLRPLREPWAGDRTDRLDRERRYLRDELARREGFGVVVGKSASFLAALRMAESLAAAETTVLVRGEVGVGKELIARVIHARSARAAGAFIKVACSGLDESALDAHLFGAATLEGGEHDRPTAFEVAAHGTLFLEELTAASHATQAKLVRALDQERQAGEPRLVVSSTRDLDEQVATGRLLRELHGRLAAVAVDVPPLRQRAEDVEPLATHFLELAARRAGVTVRALDERSVAELSGHAFRGNVRELRLAIESAVAASPDAPLRLRLYGARAVDDEPLEVLSVDDFRGLERSNIGRALVQCSWRIAGSRGAASLLGMPPSTLRDRMRALGIEKPT